jgi:hypothetical protein
MLILHCITIYSQNIAFYASFFNATYTCDNPLVLNSTVTIYLDEDIIIDQCIPIIAGPLLTSTDQLIFTSFDNHKLIIKANTVVNFNDFLPDQQNIVFTGNAIFLVEKGVYLIFDENKLIATQNAHIFFVKSSN